MGSDRAKVEHAAARWTAKRDAGPWTDADAAAFAAWLAEAPGNRAAYYRLNGAWQEAGRLKALIGTKSVASFQIRRARLWLRHPLTLAASLLLAIGATLFVFREELFQRENYSTVVGGLQAIPMVDGSKVTLNTASELRIALTESERQVELERGEAFFEVVKDPKRPFIVRAGRQRIVAVGTAFSVRREGDDVRILVSEGVVRVLTSSQGSRSALLGAGTIARVQHGEVILQKKPLPEVEQQLSWRDGVLTFRDTPLADAIAEFNRYNVQKIVTEDPDVASIEIGGIFRATNLDAFVHLLEDGFPVTATVEQERIVLRSRRLK